MECVEKSNKHVTPAVHCGLVNYEGARNAPFTLEFQSSYDEKYFYNLLYKWIIQ